MKLFKPRINKFSHEVVFGGEVIPINITLSKRRSFSLTVYPTGRVEAKAPLNSRLPQLYNRIAEKAEWIARHREKFRKLPNLSVVKKFEDGEVFAFMGVKYTLRVSKSAHARVELNEGFMDVFIKTRSPSAVKTLLKFWYNERAREVFAQRMPHCLEMTAGLKLPQHRELKIRLMKGRWGSCATSRVITLNAELVSAPMECIDYVIVHELCHLREHNHSKRYYKLLSAAMPDWKTRKNLLNKTVEVRFIA